MIADAFMDGVTVLYGELLLKVWVRIWVSFLLIGVLFPLAFLPHPFAIANLVAVFIIVLLNGRERTRVRGVKLSTSCACQRIASGEHKLHGTMQKMMPTYEQARVVADWYNTVVLAVSCAFDTYDTFRNYCQDEKEIDRSKWTTDRLQQNIGAPNEQHQNHGA